MRLMKANICLLLLLLFPLLALLSSCGETYTPEEFFVFEELSDGTYRVAEYVGDPESNEERMLISIPPTYQKKAGHRHRRKSLPLFSCRKHCDS